MYVTRAGNGFTGGTGAFLYHLCSDQLATRAQVADICQAQPLQVRNMMTQLFNHPDGIEARLK